MRRGLNGIRGPLGCPALGRLGSQGEGPKPPKRQPWRRATPLPTAIEISRRTTTEKLLEESYPCLLYDSNKAVGVVRIGKIPSPEHASHPGCLPRKQESLKSHGAVSNMSIVIMNDDIFSNGKYGADVERGGPR